MASCFLKLAYIDSEDLTNEEIWHMWPMDICLQHTGVSSTDDLLRLLQIGEC